MEPTGKVANAEGLSVDHILALCCRAGSVSLLFVCSSKLVKTVREEVFLVGLIVWKVELIFAELTLKVLEYADSVDGGSKSKGIEEE